MFETRGALQRTELARALRQAQGELLSPFALSLSKGPCRLNLSKLRIRMEGFDRLSPNGSGRRSPFPFTLDLSKGLGR